MNQEQSRQPGADNWRGQLGDFPAPGPMPTRTDGESYAEWQARLEDWYAREGVHKAVHGSELWERFELAGCLARDLLDGHPLPGPYAEWLAWVLVELIKKRAVPTRYGSRQFDVRATRRMVARLYEHLRESKAPTRDMALEEAATRLGRSYSTLRRLYLSRFFQRFRRKLSGKWPRGRPRKRTRKK
jgi:hypothetical protein